MTHQTLQIRANGHDVQSLADWKKLAPPKGREIQWKQGRSAYECAASWFGPDGKPAVPAELQKLLDSHDVFAESRITSVFPEHKVRFDSLSGEPRNADVNAIAQTPKGLVALSIEAKADESYDRPVSSVLDAAVKKMCRDEKTNAILRVQQLAESILGRERWPRLPLGDIRYQLLTGVAGALAFAKQQKAGVALFVIHEFVTDHTDDGRHLQNLRDLNRFVERLQRGRTIGVSCGDVVGPIEYHGTPLFGGADRPTLFLAKIRRVSRAPGELKVFGRPYDELVVDQVALASNADWRARFSVVSEFAGGEGGCVYLADSSDGFYAVTSETVFADLLGDDEPTESMYRFESAMSREVWCAERFGRLRRCTP